MISDPCNKCNGNGKVQSNENVTVKIPKGVDDGTRIRVSGKGEASPLPDTLILVPSSTPFGILTVTFSFDCTFPLPLHLLQGSLIISPYPLH